MDLVLASIKSLLLRKNDAKIDELDEQIRKHENKISQLRDVWIQTKNLNALFCHRPYTTFYIAKVIC